MGKKYHLTKDWLINFAHYIIWQFSKNTFLQVKDIHVSGLRLASLVVPGLLLKGPQWRAGEEDKESFEKKLDELYLSTKKKYFVDAYRDLDLQNQKDVTKPIDYEKVKYLVRWTIQGWSIEQIQHEMDRDKSEKSGKEEYVDLSGIYKMLARFETYNLPVRKKSRGFKKGDVESLDLP